MTFESLRNQLMGWNKNTTDRQKLQLIYLLAIVVSFFVAAIASLANHGLGMTILKVTVVAIVVFSVNAVIWAMLHTFVLDKLVDTTRQSNRRR